MILPGQSRDNPIVLVSEGNTERRFTERHHGNTTETSDNGQPHPVYVNSATMHEEDKFSDDDDNLSEHLIRQSSKRSKSKMDGMMTQKSWMFRQEAEEHYFGSIVVMNSQASALGLNKLKNQASTFIGRMASEGDGL